MKSLYLSGKMTGEPEFNFPLFNAEAARLRALGYRVINPAELDALEENPMSWSQYLRRDIAELVKCDAICMLPNWRNSRGATLEHHVAVALGMTVTDAHLLTERVG